MNMFRAWSAKTKEMIYIDDFYWFEENGVHDFNGSGHYDSYIIMKASGLPDKNQDEIYEGDILECEDRIVYVAWHEECGTWDCKFIKYINDLCSNGIMPVEWKYRAKKIGNIYENPELLKPYNPDYES